MAKNHFVPQFYLKGFVDPSSKGPRSPYLWVVDLKNRTLKRRGPKNVAKIAGFYDWEEEGDEALSIEELFSQVEGRASKVISKLRNNNFNLTLMQDRLDLSNFIGLQITRTPFSRKLLEKGLKTYAQDWIDELVQDEERFRERFESYIEHKGDNESELTVESMRDFIENNRFEVIPKPDNVLAGTMILGNHFAKIIFIETYWLFLVATGGAKFFTSDRPVSAGKASRMDLRGGRTPKFELTFPISPSCMLFLHQYERISVVEGVDFLEADKVGKLNKAMLSNADRYVFSSSKQQGKWVLEQSEG